jgi:nicotinamidase-related amidase
MKLLAPSAALLVIDMQKGFDRPGWGRRNNPGTEARVAELLDEWRTRALPVLHVKHVSTSSTSPLRPGQEGVDFKPDTAPRAGEAVVEKRVHSAFIGTSLEADLRRARIRTLVLVGLTTNHCVSTTARMASNLGFDTWVVSDATATFDRVGPDGARYPADLVHAMALSDLHGEFAFVAGTDAVMTALRGAVRRAS